MLRILAAILFTTGIAAQTLTLGTPSDPCTGGAALQIFQSTNTLRWDNTGFSCTFPVANPGAYIVQMDFLEPCYSAGACAGGQITKAGQRIENAYVNDQPALSGFDTFAAGATDKQAASRFAVVYAAKSITIRVQTVVRSGVLAAVSIIPFDNVQLTRQQCIGAGNFSSGVMFNCAGIELLTVSQGGITRQFVASEAPASIASFPLCPASGPCLKTVDLSQSFLKVMGDLNGF